MRLRKPSHDSGQQKVACSIKRDECTKGCGRQRDKKGGWKSQQSTAANDGNSGRGKSDQGAEKETGGKYHRHSGWVIRAPTPVPRQVSLQKGNRRTWCGLGTAEKGECYPDGDESEEYKKQNFLFNCNYGPFESWSLFFTWARERALKNQVPFFTSLVWSSSNQVFCSAFIVMVSSETASITLAA